MKFTIVFDGAEYDIMPCPEGADKAEIERQFPASAGWTVLESTDTMDQAAARIEEHRARTKASR